MVSEGAPNPLKSRSTGAGTASALTAFMNTLIELSVTELETVTGGDDDEIIVFDNNGRLWTCTPTPGGGDGDYSCTSGRTVKEFWEEDDDNGFA